MFEFREDEHAVKAEKLFRRGVDGGKIENVTRSALASLRLAIKAYFETYYVCSRNNIVLSIDPTHPFYDIERDHVKDLCNDLVYQEKYMQCIFHFHHFFELFLKDILKSKHPYLALKISLDSKNALNVLNIINNNVSAEDMMHDNTVEFELALSRVISLKDIDHVSNIIGRHITTLKSLNTLRNRAWHRGLLILRVTALDDLVSKNIFPLMLELFKVSSYKDTERYWKYRTTKIDPIDKIIEHSTINYKALMFFKAYGLACYNLPHRNWNLELDDTIRKAKAITDALHNLEVDECPVCEEETLLVSTEHDFDNDHEGNPVAGWWNTTAAECLNCRFLVYPDVGEPKDYGVGSKTLWANGSFDF